MQSLAKPLLLALAVGLLSACDSVPKEEFKAYSEAFAQVGEASERILIEYSLAKQDQAERESARNPSADAAEPPKPYPDPSALERLLDPETPDEDIAQRRRAIEVVARYNDLMLVLAEGKSPSEVRSSVDSLVAAINGIGSLANLALPGIPGPAVAIATQFIEAIQAADNRAQFAEALRQGEPLIQGILLSLKADALDIYQIRWAMAEITTDAHIVAIIAMVNQIRLALGEFSAPPANSSGFAQFNEKLEGTLASVGLTKPATWPSDASRPEFSALALSQIEQTQKLIAAEAASITALQAEMKAYADVTVAYIALIQQATASLSQVRLALDQPVDIKAQALQLIGFAFELKRNIEALDASRVTPG